MIGEPALAAGTNPGMQMQNLLDLDADGLTAWFAAQGEKPFRARQVLRWCIVPGWRISMP